MIDVCVWNLGCLQGEEVELGLVMNLIILLTSLNHYSFFFWSIKQPLATKDFIVHTVKYLEQIHDKIASGEIGAELLGLNFVCDIVS